MTEQDYPKELFVLIERNLPYPWDEIVFYAEYGVSSYSIEFWIKNGSSYTKCFDLPGIDEEALLDSFDEMNEVLEVQRSALPKDALWSSMTMTVHSSGKVKVDFDYSDLSSEEASRDVWKAHYLN